MAKHVETFSHEFRQRIRILSRTCCARISTLALLPHECCQCRPTVASTPFAHDSVHCDFGAIPHRLPEIGRHQQQRARQSHALRWPTSGSCQSVLLGGVCGNSYPSCVLRKYITSSVLAFSLALSLFCFVNARKSATCASGNLQIKGRASTVNNHCCSAMVSVPEQKGFRAYGQAGIEILGLGLLFAKLVRTIPTTYCKIQERGSVKSNNNRGEHRKLRK